MGGACSFDSFLQIDNNIYLERQLDIERLKPIF